MISVIHTHAISKVQNCIYEDTQERIKMYPLLDKNQKTFTKLTAQAAALGLIECQFLYFTLQNGL